jgi:putative ABC transport system permease protein
MTSHYFKLARKVLVKNKYYTFINVFGLVCGMLTALVIGKYIGGSLQFDSFHLKRDRIYSITQEETIEGSPEKERTATYYGVAELLRQFPEVVNFARYDQHVEALVMAEDEAGDQKTFTENKIFITDSSFFDIFTFPLIHGDPKTALSKINSIVLTKSTSQKYFGNANPIGKSLTIRSPWGQEITYMTTGVMENIPLHSRFQFDFLITRLQISPEEFWNFPDYSTYMLLKDNVNDKELSEKLTNALTHVPQLKSSNRKVILSLASLADIELSNIEYLLTAVGIFVTLICWLNYINQIVGQSLWRIKEISVLRVLGASWSNLRTQFIVESTIICVISLVLVIAIYLAFEKSLQSVTGGHLLPLMSDPTLVNLIFLAIFIVGIAFASAVPNIIFSSQNVGATLRNIHTPKIGGIGLRKLLVIFQFSISTILMIGLFVTTNQLQYVTKKDKGFAMKDVLIAKTPMVKDTTWNVKKETMELFKKRCRELPFVIDITSSTTVPGEEYRHETYLSLQNNRTKTLVHQAGVDENFFSMFEIKFLAGHDFIPDARAQNRSSIILNKSAANALGISDFNKLLITRIIDHEEPDLVYDLIGIVNDHHQTSLKYEMRPMAFRFNELRGHFSIKLNSARSVHSREEQLMTLKQIWDETYPDASFDTFMLNEKYEAENMEDQYFGKLFASSTILSIIISCLGLFGLSLLISTKRQKEIAIRKTFGASSTSILVNFLKGYLAPLSISMIIGSSLAYFLMNAWLSSYAYRIEIGLGLVLSAIFSIILVFLFAVSYHTIKSSNTNPVNILKE